LSIIKILIKSNMTTIELKSDLHLLIDRISDSNVLEAYHTLLKREVKEVGDFWDELTNAQKEDIQAGIDDLEAGRKKPLSEVMSKYL
jgi:predicted transcriptional regulator